jgi:hypothetical protein
MVIGPPAGRGQGWKGHRLRHAQEGCVVANLGREWRDKPLADKVALTLFRSNPPYWGGSLSLGKAK